MKPTPFNKPFTIGHKVAITPKTRAIVPLHAGVACEMDRIITWVDIGSSYLPLGSGRCRTGAAVLPLYYEMSDTEIARVTTTIKNFFCS